jgi:polysaccharide export outer membrane protein
MTMSNNAIVCRAFVLVALVSAAVAAQDKPLAPAGPPSADQSDQARAVYELGPDDEITVRVTDVPEIGEKPQRLDPNGNLRFPMIGRVHAAGLTVDELESELKTRLAVFLREPDVSIAVTEFRSQPVSVIGAVSTPGVRQLDGRRTLVEVLSLAGGLSTDAGPVVRVARQLSQGRIPLPEASDDPRGMLSVVDIDVKALLESRAPDKNVVLKPFDVVSVPRVDIVYVIGEVGKPGPVPLSGGQSISVMEAVSASGGALRTAQSARVRVLRHGDVNGKRAEVEVDLQKIMQGKADDIRLTAGDILVVPDNTGRRLGVRMIEAAIQMGTIIGSYAIVQVR